MSNQNLRGIRGLVFVGGWMSLAGCNIDTAAAEFYARYTTGDAGGEGSGTAGESTSSGGSSTGGSTEGEEASSGGSGAASAETGEGSSGGSTGGGTTGTTMLAVCGNGVVEAGEECDDGDDEDTNTCDNGCAAAWTIFVTGVNEGGIPGYTGKMHGLDGADTRCRKHAMDGGQPRYMKFKALLSDSDVDAADRLYHGRGYYRLVNGQPVAHGWDALMNAPLENPINVTELGETYFNYVWTGTQPGGTAVPGAEHCGDWDVEGDFIKGHFGISDAVDAAWLMYPDPELNPFTCYSENSLYCVEQP